MILKRFLVLFLPSLALLVAAVGFLYLQDLRKEISIIEYDRDRAVDLQVEIIAKEYGSVASDVLRLAEQRILRDFLVGDPDQRRLAAEYLQGHLGEGLYDRIGYLDGGGREVVRVEYADGGARIVPDGRLLPDARRLYSSQVFILKRGEVYVSPFGLGEEEGGTAGKLDPAVRFATPVMDGKGHRRGILVVHYQGERLIRTLNQVSTNASGLVMIVDEDGFRLRGSGAEGASALGGLAFAKAHPKVWERISKTGSGQFLGGEGLFTFRTHDPGGARPDGIVLRTPPDGSSLKVVSFVPRDLLYRKSKRLLRRLLFPFAVAVLLFSVLAGFLSYVGMIRERDQGRIRESESRLRRLSSHWIANQERELRGLSRDLHDDLGQLVTAVCLDLERSLRPGGGARREKAIKRALEGARGVLDKVHEISSRLRPRVLDDLGLKDAVRSYLSEYEARTGIETRADLRFEHQDVPADVRGNVYRILQEALTNVSKYARAKKVFVGMHASSERITLTVKDEGVGFRTDELKGDSLGILSMRERAELLGGDFKLTAEPGKGTEVRVSMPISAAESNQV
ncbi:MAG: ATP-binding protein [Elusimicrobiota bacterium]